MLLLIVSRRHYLAMLDVSFQKNYSFNLPDLLEITGSCGDSPDTIDDQRVLYIRESQEHLLAHNILSSLNFEVTCSAPQ